MKKFLPTTAALALIMTASVIANSIDPHYQSCAMFGINRENGLLKKFNFETNQLTTIGTVKHQGTTLLGIDASAYINGHSNIIAFHKADADADSRMVYINTQTAKATPVGAALGKGRVTGAVASTNGTASVGGLINLNPNNSPSNEFTMITVNGVPYTRDNLHQNAQIDENGTFFEGEAHFAKFKPKGNGNQNGLSVNGTAYTLDNGKLYTLVGSMNVRLYNDSVNGNGKAMGKWWLQIVSGTAFVLENGNMQEGGSTGKAPMSVYAVQDFNAADLDTGGTGGTDETVDFTITGDKVVASESFALKVTVIGAAISNGSYDFPVTTKFNVGGQILEPFGSYDLAVTGNVNDDQNPRSHIFDGTFNANTSVTTIGKSWIKKRSSKSGNSNSHWKTYMSVSSENSDSQQLMVLRDGDDVPDIPGFENQNSIEDFLSDYIADGKISLTANQAIFLFELGTTNINSSAADFQDLVVLVTLGKTVESLTEPGEGSGSSTPGDPGTPGGTDPSPVVSRLIKVNHLTGGYSQLMTLERKYDSLATSDSLNFYATAGNKLYKIDTANQTETEVGTMAATDMLGLEFAGTTLMGFQNASDLLNPMNHLTAGTLGTAASLGMTDLGTIVFMTMANDPASKPVSYD